MPLCVTENSGAKGTMLEKYLTLPPEEFDALLKRSEPPADETAKKEAYF